MKFGIVGLGRMGLSLGELAVEKGHEVVAWDPDDSARQSATKAGMSAVDELADVPGELSAPRVILMWVPHGKPADENLEQLLPGLEKADVVADCGNSFWEDSRKRHDEMAEKGLHFLDIGTSGGISDAPGWNGAAFMAGGPRAGFDIVKPLLEDMAVDEQAVHYVGPSPSGHGTVIRSWLVELMAHGLAEGGIGPEFDVPPAPDTISSYVEDTDEVKWVVKWAIDHDIPVPVSGMSQQMLMAHRADDAEARR